MPILENFENAWDPEFQLDVHPLINLYNEHNSLANKIFSETVCSECYESTPMVETDNMGRDTSMYKEPS
jgi:hypothetical protein